jgi:hypothetical protein
VVSERSCETCEWNNVKAETLKFFL